MDERLELNKSPIHGTGVFAKQRIRRNELIGIFHGTRTRRNGMFVLWIEDGDDVVGIDGKGALRHLNHSARPNAVFHGDRLYALRDIKPGAEVTIHYGEDWVSAQVEDSL